MRLPTAEDRQYREAGSDNQAGSVTAMKGG
jgi:hypothetical protein